MRSTGVPTDVRLFILRYIDSVELLEVLLFTYKNKGQSWSADQIASALRSVPESVEGRLNQLERDGFLKVAPDAKRFEYDSSRESEVETLSKLDQLYGTYRIRIIELIYSRPSDRIRTFANAFRFKREEDDG